MNGQEGKNSCVLRL